MNEKTKDDLLITLCIITGILLAVLIVVLIIFCRKKVSHGCKKTPCDDTDLRYVRKCHKCWNLIKPRIKSQKLK